eukprot:167443-Amphidinium_carterae.1
MEEKHGGWAAEEEEMLQTWIVQAILLAAPVTNLTDSLLRALAQTQRSWQALGCSKSITFVPPSVPLNNLDGSSGTRVHFGRISAPQRIFLAFVLPMDHEGHESSE